MYSYGIEENVTATEYVVVEPDTDAADDDPTALTIQLPAPPPPTTHRITIAGLLSLWDDDNGTDWYDNSGRTIPFVYLKDLVPDVVGYEEQLEILEDYCYHDELRVKIWLKTQIIADASDAAGNFSDNEVSVKMDVRFYEGTSCSDALGDQAGETQRYEVIMAPGAWDGSSLYEDNTDEGVSDDYMKLSFLVTHDYVWRNPVARDVGFELYYAYGDGGLFEVGEQSRFFTLTANERFGVFEFEDNANRRYLRTPGIVVLLPNNQDVATMMSVSLSGAGGTGPIIWRDLDAHHWPLVSSGQVHVEEMTLSNDLGWVDFDAVVSNL